MPLTDYYANKYSAGDEVAVYGTTEGENQFMLQAQRQMQQQRGIQVKY